MEELDMMDKIKSNCNRQTCCLDCPMFQDNACLLVKVPFSWDMEKITEQAKKI